MAAASSSSSSSFCETEEQPQRYQVFLSYHLRDFFHGFIRHLFYALKNDNIEVHTVVTSEYYDNISIFIDNDGDKREPLETLLTKVEESRIALAIISTKYIKSKWSLRELSFMKYCVEKGKLVFIPIFYKLDYKYLNHEVERDVTETNECTQVLRWIRDLDGITVKNHSSESEIFHKIAKEIKNVSRKVLSEGSRKASVDPSENIDSQTSSGSTEVVDVSQNVEVVSSSDVSLQHQVFINLESSPRIMAAASSSSSSSFSETEEQPQRYQVFLSFHLRDSFHGIVWNLPYALNNDNIEVHTVVTSEYYDNISIFIDDDGDKREPLETLLTKIEEPRIAMAIISTKYIKSKGCLKELEIMKYCVEKGKLVVIPVFYKLDYKYLNHEVERDVTETNECTQVLRWIRDLDGIIVKNHSSETEIFHKIAKEIKNVSRKVLSEGSRKASVDPSENIVSQTSSGTEKVVDVIQKAIVDPSENIDSQTSSGTQKIVEHQVFINYRGTDLSLGFVSHLIKALEDENIKVYIDNYAHKDEPSETLLTKIEESRLALAIFSINYTESSWCLRELAMIKDCVEKGKQVAIPIFYKLDPSTVSGLRGQFGDKFRKLGEPDLTRKKEWEKALKWIHDLSGITMNHYSCEREILFEIVEKVKEALKNVPSERNREAFVYPSENIDSQTSSTILRPITNSQIERKAKPPKFQVFISFRGDQLRNNFVGHLVNALRRNEINVFIDNQEKRGEDLNILFKRIDDSGLAIVVFSSRYTESKWCLEELVRIKERMDQGVLKVLPIFYNVTPTNVKRLKGEFGDHFRDKEYKYEYDEPMIKRWKEAIKAVSHKFALTFDEKSGVSESEFVETIVKDVLKILQDISKVEIVKFFMKIVQEKIKGKSGKSSH